MSRLSLATAIAFLLVLALAATSIFGSPLDQAIRGAEHSAVNTTDLSVSPFVLGTGKRVQRRSLDMIWKRRPVGGWMEVVNADGHAVYRSGEAKRRPLSRQVQHLAREDGAAVRSARLGDDEILVAVPVSTGRGVRARSLVAVYRLPLAPFQSSARDRLAVFSALAIIGSALMAVVLLLNQALGRLRRQTIQLRTHATASAFLAEHDALTGLPNRSLLRDRAHELIVKDHCQIALLMIDLDEFKEINDTLGHSAGDQLLREVGRRLRDAVTVNDTVARLGGDEFAVLAAPIGSVDEARRMASRIRDTLARPCHLDGLTLEVLPSIGVAALPEHASDFETLLQYADIAMYEAKRRRTGIEVYSAGRGIDRRFVGMGGELRRAIDAGQLCLHYQPKMSMTDGTVTGLEGLVRWEHPTRGLVPPDLFIPLAERSGLIRSLTRCVIDQACDQSAEWRRENILTPIAVNLSTRDLIDLELVEQLDAIVADFDVPRGFLEFEITESILMADPVRAEAVIARLKDRGVRVAIDDFGTGYSSLAYLRRLPVNSLKIDRTFVETLAAATPDEVIVRSTIDLAHNLNLTVVAEGVETEQVWNRLSTLGCDYGQGYFISRPLAKTEATAYLRAASLSRVPTEHSAPIRLLPPAA
jgi:diguanylate cyclase (GGDEF)-like protein